MGKHYIFDLKTGETRIEERENEEIVLPNVDDVLNKKEQLKQSAITKLKTLGLTDEEIEAIIK